MSDTTLTKDRICTVLREKLYSMADNESQEVYTPFELKWVLPVSSTEGTFSVIKNLMFILGYVQEHKCSKECIDRIIENDVRPMVVGLKDEMDFILSWIIIVTCDTVEDYTNTDLLMSISRGVLGKFIEALEKVDNELLTDNNVYNEDIQEIDTTGLEIGMVIKNYKELCKILGQDVKDGKSKKYQLENFKRYFDFEKSGQKFVIIDIYDIPLTKEDRRKLGNNSIYVKYIELILLQYLSKQEGYTKTFTKRNWWELLGMVNRKYNKISKKQLKQIDYVITQFEIDHFYQRCNKKLEQILFSALNNLQNRKLLIWEMQTVIVGFDEKGKEKYFLANDEDKKKILQAERHILKNVMGYEKIIQVFCRFKQNEYYKLVNDRIYELYGWHHYFKQIKLIYTQKDVLEAIQQSEIELQKSILNEKIIKVLNDNAQEKYNTEKQKLDELHNNLIWGNYKSITRSKVWDIPDTYLEAQRILTDELINIGHKNKLSFEQFEEDDELSQLFTSFMY